MVGVEVPFMACTVDVCCLKAGYGIESGGF
jgi:hypothetical protein